MFRCEACNKVIGPKVSPIRKVVGRRNRTKSNRYAETTIIGWEITKEISLCRKCSAINPLKGF